MEDIMDIHIGRFIWARMTTRYLYWPGIVVDPLEGGLKSDASKLCIFWIGDDRISFVAKSNIQDYLLSFNENYCKGGIKLKEAIEESIDLFMIHNYNVNVKEIMFDEKVKVINNLQNHATALKDFSLPIKVQNALFKIKNMNLGLEPKKNGKINKPLTKENLSVALKKNEIRITDICIKCFSDSKCSMHPFTNVGLCRNCKQKYLKTFFMFNEDKKKVSCFTCGETATSWNKENFLLAFCGFCLKHLKMLLSENSLNIIVSNGGKISRHNQAVFLTAIENIFKDKDDEFKLVLTTSHKWSVIFVTLHDLESSQHEKVFSRFNNSYIKKSAIFKSIHFIKENLSFFPKKECVNNNLIIGQPSLIGDVWFDESDGVLTVKNCLVEYFFEFYRLVNSFKMGVWVLEYPAAIDYDFIELISRFLRTTPFLIISPTSRNQFTQFYRLIWTNSTVTDIKNLYQVKDEGH